ncbi:MAG: type II toxin-antitoxin system prevent-host-death family antitoxin [Rhizobiales bacterium]|nr:type II toxin-antitoxin system prevent-host-death family antitoxin [Rhizobacter sp.]
MNVTATEAKNRLGHVLEQAQSKPVFIEKAGRRHSVVMSVAHYEALVRAGQTEPPIATSEQFYKRYKEWVDEQNRLVETYGVFGEEWRPW